MDNPEGHDAPVQDNEDAKVELEHRGKQGKGDDPCRNSEEVPAELDDDSQVADGLLVIPRLSQGLLVGGQGPGQRDEGGCCCHTCNRQAHRHNGLISVPHQCVVFLQLISPVFASVLSDIYIVLYNKAFCKVCYHMSAVNKSLIIFLMFDNNDCNITINEVRVWIGSNMQIR